MEVHKPIHNPSIRIERKRGVYSLITGLALSLTACASLVEARVEQTMLDLLPSIVGPGDYVVEVSGVERRAGEIVDIRQVRAVGERVARPESPVLDRVEVDLEGVREREQGTRAGVIINTGVQIDEHARSSEG